MTKWGWIVLVATLALLGAGGWFCYHEGYEAARAECSAAFLQSQLKAQKQIVADEARQVADQNAVTDRLAEEKSASDAAMAGLKAQIAKTKVAKDCTVGPDAIAILNHAMAAQ